jgi:hypothetical protein
MGLLSAEIANESSPAHVRQSAALALKNQLTAKVTRRKIMPDMVGTNTPRRVSSKMDCTRS